MAENLCVPIQLVLRVRGHESVVARRLDELKELELAMVGVDLVLDLGLLYSQLEHELLLLVELVRERVGHDGQHVELACLVEANELLALRHRYHFLVELDLLNVRILDILMH